MDMSYSVLQGISNNTFSVAAYDSKLPKEKDEGLMYGDRELSIRIGRGVSHKGKHPCCLMPRMTTPDSWAVSGTSYLVIICHFKPSCPLNKCFLSGSEKAVMSEAICSMFALVVQMRLTHWASWKDRGHPGAGDWWWNNDMNLSVISHVNGK